VTSTKHCAGALAALMGVALGLMTAGLSHGQPPKKRKVDLNVRGGKDHVWKVIGSGDGFAAVRIRQDDRMPYYHNFRATAGRMWVSGRCMSYDLEGRSKDVLARTDDRGEETKWERERPRVGWGGACGSPRGR
jgi:hypothetical protein